MLRFGSLRYLRPVFVTLGVCVALFVALCAGATYAGFQPGAVYWPAVESTVRIEFPDSIMAAADDDTSGGGTAGTGFYITPHLVLTCAHIGDTARHCVVSSCYESDSTVAGRVLYADTLRDIALIFTERAGTPLPLASQLPSVGESVGAIGNPHGYLGTFSLGVVSQHRSDDESGNTTIQCTAAAQPGSSGGPLLNESGEVVGMVAEGGEGFTFAIDVQSIRSVLYHVWDVYVLMNGSPRATWTAPATELTAIMKRDSAGASWDWELILACCFVAAMLVALGLTLYVGFARRRQWARERLARQEWELARGQALLPEIP
jgi:hypothetical protein